MDTLKKLLYFAEICGYLFGAVGAFGWSVYCKNWPAAVGVVILAAMAFPELKRAIHNIQE